MISDREQSSKRMSPTNQKNGSKIVITYYDVREIETCGKLAQDEEKSHK